MLLSLAPLAVWARPLPEALCETHHIIAVARTVGALEALDDRIQKWGGQAVLAPMDITDAKAMAHLCHSIYERWGKIDLWAHSAIHAAPLSPASTLDQKDWDKSVAINVTATGVLIPFVAPLLGEAAKQSSSMILKLAKVFFRLWGE